MAHNVFCHYCKRGFSTADAMKRHITEKHQVDSVDGIASVEGKKLYYFENIVYDISGLLRLVEENPKKYGPYFTEIDQTIMYHLSKYVEPDIVRILTMSKEERSVPVLAVLLEDGTTRIVDGYHRIQRLQRDGIRKMEVFLIPPSDAAPFITVK